MSQNGALATCVRTNESPVRNFTGAAAILTLRGFVAFFRSSLFELLTSRVPLHGCRGSDRPRFFSILFPVSRRFHHVTPPGAAKTLFFQTKPFGTIDFTK